MAYDKELAFALNMAKIAGKVMRQYYRQDQQVDRKVDQSLITIADRQINDLVIKEVKENFADHGVLGEEASYRTELSKLWVCDPIDGTLGFVHHIPTCMFALAYCQDGDPKVAVCYNPQTHDLYQAVKGQGAFLNGTKLLVSGKQADKRVALGGISMLQRQSKKDLDKIVKDMGWSSMNVGWAVFNACLVAEGSFDGYIYSGIGAHDVAASTLLVTEAGGQATDMHGNPPKFDGPVKGAVLSNGKIHKQLLDLAKE